MPHVSGPLTVWLGPQRRKGRSKPDGSGPRVIAPQVDQAYGKSPQPPASQFETAILQFLAVFFIAIMTEGVFLAVSVCRWPDAAAAVGILLHHYVVLPDRPCSCPATISRPFPRCICCFDRGSCRRARIALPQTSYTQPSLHRWASSLCAPPHTASGRCERRHLWPGQCTAV